MDRTATKTTGEWINFNPISVSYVEPCSSTPALRITRRKWLRVNQDTWPLWATSSDRPVSGRVSAGNHIIRSAWKAHHGHSVMQLTKERFCWTKVTCNTQELRIELREDFHNNASTEAKEDETHGERKMKRWSAVWTDMWYFRHLDVFFLNGYIVSHGEVPWRLQVDYVAVLWES